MCRSPQRLKCARGLKTHRRQLAGFVQPGAVLARLQPLRVLPKSEDQIDLTDRDAQTLADLLVAEPGFKQPMQLAIPRIGIRGGGFANEQREHSGTLFWNF